MINDFLIFRENATRLLNEAEDINKSLKDAQEAQKEAEDAIEVAWTDYTTVETILDEVSDKKSLITINSLANLYLKQKLRFFFQIIHQFILVISSLMVFLIFFHCMYKFAQVNFLKSIITSNFP